MDGRTRLTQHEWSPHHLADAAEELDRSRHPNGDQIRGAMMGQLWQQTRGQRVERVKVGANALSTNGTEPGTWEDGNRQVCF